MSIWIKILLLLCLGTPLQAQQKNRGLGGFTVHLGEAFTPTNYRLTFPNSDIDFGISANPMTTFYIGSRNFSGNSYVGYGLVLNSSPGFYGSIGYEATFNVLAVGAEFNAGGSVNGVTRAVGTFSIGVLW